MSRTAGPQFNLSSTYWKSSGPLALARFDPLEYFGADSCNNALDDYEDKYGVLALVKWVKGEGGHFPLCDLEGVDEGSDNYHLLRNYVVWFANR